MHIFPLPLLVWSVKRKFDLKRKIGKNRVHAIFSGRSPFRVTKIGTVNGARPDGSGRSPFRVTKIGTVDAARLNGTLKSARRNLAFALEPDEGMLRNFGVSNESLT
jgi:hypothetical protein